MTIRPTRLALLERIESQIARIDIRLVPLQQQSYRLSWLRVLLFLVGIVASFASLWLGILWLFAVVFLFSVAAFFYVVYRHQQIEQSIARFVGWQQIKREQLARARIDWQAIPSAAPISGPIIGLPDHPFADDLDLSGERSLHRLLDGTVTLGGSQRLYEWLAATAPNLAHVLQRQRLVGELAPLALWRTRFMLDARVEGQADRGQQPARLQLDGLLSWFQHNPAQSSSGWELLLSFALLGIAGVLGILFLLDLTGAWWQFPYAAYFLLQLLGSQTSGRSFADATSLQARLEQLVAILHHVEAFGYQRQPQLRNFCAPILDQPNRPSQLLRRIRWVVGAIGVQSNPVVGLLCNAFFPWNLFFARRLQVVKAEAARGLPTWIETLYELDALNALATFAHLHPNYCFPTLVATEADSAAEALSITQLGHPLLAHQARVRNDFRFEQLGTLALITGSNMAGKSAFLRAIGLNLVLAFAGSVVDASELRTPMLRLFTSIKISDSVTQGVSYFYAEVKRLKRLLDELQEPDPRPLLFCIDEIFRGTNNRERLIGSRSYIRHVVGKHGVGLISTHDLDLVTLADELPLISNYHFRDAVVNGEMVFDYKLHPGPCPTTNALKVMANAGLPIDT